MAKNQIITVTARKAMVRARAGEVQIPKIVGFVFGDGGVDDDGNVIPPGEEQAELGHELLRKPYDTYTPITDTSYRYDCALGESELGGCDINEIGLYDSNGNIVTIKRFTNKGKDSDLSMNFWIKDTF